HRPPDEGRALPGAAGPRADRTPAGRLAGDVVARRGGREPPARAPAPRRGGHRPAPRRRVRRCALSDARPVTQTWPALLGALIGGHDLDAGSTTWAMGEILSGDATGAQIAGFAVALRAKGETAAELQGLVDAMYAKATTLDLDDRVVDIVGTGGDMAKTVNISSMAAVTTAGAGIGVVKHGNRAASSQSGTADVFERLGVRLDVPAEHVLDVYREAGITFCFAPVFHASMRFAGPARRELGIPTFFNFLGPLTNPARPAASAIGCADPRMAPLMAE